MKYRESSKDKKLRDWFQADVTRALLRRIILQKGYIRGLNALDVSFNYPIAAIAGKNGAGKSTVLALACCAFHSNKDGFKLSKRKHPYYTFSDFFIQQLVEKPLEGLEIRYLIAYNGWKKSPASPDGVGQAWQVRKKKKDGKWNDYDTRVHRTVVFLGIERIVPHSERSQSKSYSKVFKDSAPRGWENKVMDAVGFILGKTYTDFRYLAHSKYNLPCVTCNGVTYSGFNMGAGENALFDIFSSAYAAGDGALLVMDEIELGLHAAAQRKFIDRLKDVCLERHLQIICTTHSREVFDCLPNDARYFVEKINEKTHVIPGVSSDLALSKMNEVASNELDVLVEDDVAKAILLASLTASLRSRITIKIIGSASALARQLAAAYVRAGDQPVIAVFDGDQLARSADNRKHAANMAESTNSDFTQWYNARVCHLPGDTWPEIWLLSKAASSPDALAEALSCDVDSLVSFILLAQQAGKHNEFHEIAKHLGLDRQTCLHQFARCVSRTHVAELKDVVSAVESALISCG